MGPDGVVKLRLRRFHEPAQLDIAPDAAQEGLGRRRRQAVYEALADHLDPRAPELSPSRRRWQAQMLVSLAAEGFVDWTEAVWESFDLLVGEAREQPDVDSLRTVVALPTCAPERPDLTDRLGDRRLLGEALGRLDRTSEAIEVLSSLVEERGEQDQGEAYADDLNALALALNEGGHAEHSLGLLGRVHEILASIYGASAAELWITRNDIAMTLDDLDRTDEAIPAMEDLVADIGSVGPERTIYDTARTNLAQCYVRTDQLESAIFFSQTSAHMATTRHGPSHPLTLEALATLSHAAWQAGAAAPRVIALTGIPEYLIQVATPAEPGVQ